MATPTHEEMLGMSDEDFSGLNSPPAVDPNTADPATEDGANSKIAPEVADSTDTVIDAANKEGDTSLENNAADADDPTEEKAEDIDSAEDGEKEPEKATTTGSESASTTDKGQESEGTEDSKSDTPNTSTAVVDYEASFKKIMAPFKANGKMIELRTPEEAIQLMQMGANYTRKLQELQPHRKIVMMLQNNDLLDEGKLSYLIDLDKKNPEAIKKLIKDSGVDPLDIDTDVEPAYSPSSHSVSDEEANFRTVMEDIKSTPSGTETLTEIHGRWDDASKQALWKSPEIMSVIHQQRENGIYDQITAEMDRQITLGKIPASTPFLEAYKTVGDQMVEEARKSQGGNKQTGATQETSGTDPTVVTRAATPKSPLANGDKAKAASPTRSTPKKAETLKNPLAQSDEEFLKSMEGRL